MALNDATVTRLGDEFEAEYRLIIATDDARLDIKCDRPGLAALGGIVDEKLSEGVDPDSDITTQRDDPFDRLE